ncbi:MAG: hypothetical protein AAFX44_15610 [Pseudomonadota bacterium]
MPDDNHDLPEWAIFVLGFSPDGKSKSLFTQFSFADDAETLLRSFIELSNTFANEIGLDILGLLSELGKASDSNEVRDELLREKIDSMVEGEGPEADMLREAGPELVYLFMSSGSALKAIQRGETETAAYFSVMAAELASRISMRPWVATLMAGYKQAVLAPAKKREWYPDLIKAAERLRKNGVRDNKIAGILCEQFPDKSKSTIYRVLKKEGFFG